MSGVWSLAVAPTYQLAYANLGRLLQCRGEYPQARAALARYNLANVTLRAGWREDAIVLYERVVAEDPSFFMARYNLGRLYGQAGCLGEARVGATHGGS